MLFLRLKQCEVALKAGRLDEAFDLLRSPDLRSHRRGQDLVDRLGRAMIQRGRAHLAAGQLEAAANDCERAARMSGSLPEVVGLRVAVSDAMAERRRADRQRDQLVAGVRRYMDQGQLTLGQQLLAAAGPDAQTHRIASELAARRATVQAVAQKVDAVIRAGDWEAALDHLAGVDRRAARHPDVRELAGKVTALIVAEATKAIEAGHLDQARALLQRHQELPGRFLAAARLRESLRQFREASACIERADAAGAERLLRFLSAQWPGVAWITDALSRVTELRASGEALLAGPLGATGATGATRATAPQDAPRRVNDDPPAGMDDVNFLLHVDGAGGFHVVGGLPVTIGPASSSRRVDVAVMGDASLPVVTIMRSDEDYFVQSRQPVQVNDRPTTHALLAHGDAIAIGPRCRLRFRRPNPASTSAVLDVTAGRLARGDVRQIILFDRELILGPGPATHVRLDSLTGPAVLQRGAGGGGLVCRAADPVLIDGRAAGTEPIIAPGTHVTIGRVGLILVREEGAGS